jgi:hypothetical protein
MMNILADAVFQNDDPITYNLIKKITHILICYRQNRFIINLISIIYSHYSKKKKQSLKKLSENKMM